MIEIITVQGNIASGKSTLIDILKDRCINNDDIVFMKEPVSEWMDVKDNNNISMLEKFYDDQTKYSFSFQMLVMITFLKQLKDIIENNKEEHLTIIIERGIQTSKNVFTKMLYDDGKIEKVEYDIYEMYYNDMIKNKYEASKVIYINTDVDTCYERINKRARAGEELIDKTYLQKLNDYHERTFIYERDKPTLILDGNENIFEKEVINKWLDEIEHFINCSKIINIDLKNIIN